MEEQLFARTYPSETSNERLSRLETTVFGASRQEQSMDSRVKALNQFFQPKPSTEAAKSAQGSFPKASDTNPSGYLGQTLQQPEPAADGTRYPAVSAMEQKVFNRTFAEDAIDIRLSRLENRVLGQLQQGTLQERTDQLRLMVLGDVGSGASSSFAQTPGSFSSSDAPAPIAFQDQSSATSDLLQALLPMEKRILRRTYPQDILENRLSRLEMKVFNATAPELSAEDRFYRIVSVANARNPGSREQAFQRGSFGAAGGGYPYPGSSGGAAIGTFGSMLLMILMSLL